MYTISMATLRKKFITAMILFGGGSVALTAKADDSLEELGKKAAVGAAVGGALMAGGSNIMKRDPQQEFQQEEKRVRKAAHRWFWIDRANERYDKSNDDDRQR